jgi:hypothetical protein
MEFEYLYGGEATDINPCIVDLSNAIFDAIAEFNAHKNLTCTTVLSALFSCIVRIISTQFPADIEVTKKIFDNARDYCIKIKSEKCND